MELLEDENPLTLRRWLRSGRLGRRFDYDRGLLPNRYLRELDPSTPEPERAEFPDAKAHYDTYSAWLGETAMSMGYPAWNLLYYAIVGSLSPRQPNPVVAETGTNRGLSTIVMAQAVKDLGLEAVVETVELDAEMSERARRHVGAAGLESYVRFHKGDSIEFLTDLVARSPHIDFLFLDDAHDRAHVERQLDIVCEKVAVRRGKIYFDNSGAGGVADALRYLRDTHGGNVIEFANTSMCPSGNAIWQAG